MKALAFWVSVMAFPFSVSIGAGLVRLRFPDNLSRSLHAFQLSFRRSNFTVVFSQAFFLEVLLISFTLAESLLYSVLFSGVLFFLFTFQAFFLALIASSRSPFQKILNLARLPLGIDLTAALMTAFGNSVCRV